MSLFFSLFVGCGFDLGGAGKIAIDYEIDQPRIVAMSVNPPVFQPNTPVSLEALVLAPDGIEPSAARWELCGLRDDVWVEDWGLDCFSAQPEWITVLAEENPGEWAPSPSNAPCDKTPCSHNLPLLFTANIDGEDLRSTAHVSILGSEVLSEETLALPTLRDLGVDLTKTPLGNGSIYLEAFVDGRIENLQWRWYVDKGVLLKTGRTRTQGVQVTESPWGDSDLPQNRVKQWTDNIWELPKEPGRYRAVIIASGWYRPGDQSKGSKDWDEESAEDDMLWIYESNPSQTWAIVEVEVK